MRAKSMTVAIAGLLFAVAAFSAQASFHLMKVVEVFPGTAASPSAQYVVIQMYATGENFVGGHAITVFNGSGTLVGTFTFAGNVANGNNQAKILIATPQAQAFFGVTPDLAMTAALISGGGKVCWAGTLDCAAWGAYTGGTAGVGTPFNASGGGLLSGKAAIRRLDIAGSATVLDAGDDTDNCANDFVSGLPAPRNNAGVLGTVPSATCGNGVLEGLEQCDDHNLVNGDGCSSTCTITAAVVKHVIGDFNGDG
jgi:cysteine-rich repeat protein